MKRIIVGVMLAAFAMAINVPAYAASDRATADECVAFVKKAVAFAKANGKEKALAEFSNTSGQFIDRNLYIFAYDLNGVSLAIGNGNAAKMVGKNLADMRDTDGIYLIKNMIQISKTKGQGWVDYHWPNPVTKAVEAKSSYFEKVGDYFIGAGIYKQ